MDNGIMIIIIALHVGRAGATRVLQRNELIGLRQKK